MAIKVFTGSIKELSNCMRNGDGGTSAVVYEYIELNDGQIVRKLGVLGGLDAKLTFARRSGETVELHVGEADKNLLLAIKTEDGKLYANDLEKGSSSVIMMHYLMFLGCIVLGLGTGIPTLGVGLAVFGWFAWKIWKGIGKIREMRKYVRNLPNAITI